METHQLQQAICRAYIERDDERFQKHLLELARRFPAPIPVSREVPFISEETGQDFMAYGKRTRDGFPVWSPAIFDGVDWYCRISDYRLRYVTHWLPMLPDPE